MTTVPRSASSGAATTSTDSPTTVTDAPARVRIPHAPGLDGLRGLAVAAVLVFHAGPAGWLPGGFLGVSLFFTLSGYLITALALTEVSRDRTIHMAAFWARRARRLLPALILTCIGVAVASKYTDLGDTLRADLIAGLTYTSNWVLVARGQSYTALFEAPSPLVHLWSLAIEEQFYVVLPIAVWLLARRGPGQLRRRMAIGAAAVMVAGVALDLAVDDPTLAYYGTLNRAPEIAIGVLLAALTVVTTERVPTWLTAGAGVAGVITVVA
ncbi:MAG: acyltransferase, partial [Acidimicrobiales bacterium]|nr:acyltransferase [Acidimicrobiales bacterium]